jgi:hypothetical protein
VLDRIGCFAGGREVNGDRPPLTDPRGALDQAQVFVFTDQLRVPEGVDQHLRVHGPGERARTGQHRLTAR